MRSQDVLDRARRLDEGNRSREACAMLAEALRRDPTRTALVSQLCAWLLRDGREDELLVLLRSHEAEVAADPYLLLLRAEARRSLDHLHEAEADYRAVLGSGADPAQLDFAQRGLDWIEGERAAIARGRSALARARWAGAAGLFLCVGLCGLAWLLHRRQGMDAPGPAADS